MSCRRVAAESPTGEPGHKCDESFSNPMGGQAAEQPTLFWADVSVGRSQRRSPENCFILFRRIVVRGNVLVSLYHCIVNASVGERMR